MVLERGLTPTRSSQSWETLPITTLLFISSPDPFSHLDHAFTNLPQRVSTQPSEPNSLPDEINQTLTWKRGQHWHMYLVIMSLLSKTQSPSDRTKVGWTKLYWVQTLGSPAPALPSPRVCWVRLLDSSLMHSCLLSFSSSLPLYPPLQPHLIV